MVSYRLRKVLLQANDVRGVLGLGFGGHDICGVRGSRCGGSDVYGICGLGCQGRDFVFVVDIVVLWVMPSKSWF